MSRDRIKVVFFGTSEFATSTLQKLNEADFCDVVGVVTVPDKPVGRKQVLTPPPVKVAAQGLGIPVCQPERLEGDIDQCRLQEADLFVVIAYGKIIPKEILDIPKFGAINIHYSLLPKYRGAAPVQYALLNGDKETGVSIIVLDEKMDHGPVISDLRFKISDFDTSEILFTKLAEVGDKLLLETIPKYIAGEVKPVEQDHSQATYTKMIKKEDGLVDWDKSAEEIYNMWRAFQPWPGVYSLKHESIKTLKQKKIILLEVQVFKQSSESPLPLSSGDSDGAVRIGQFFVEGGKLLVRCGGGAYLEILKLQVEGKRVMSAEDFIHGYMNQ